ncbi:efflux RND transporter periplasmic adaptor subunit [Kaistia algarum]|uniref:efflux RND transporter periplasmic adaptor subunit n=1 Tax=Kaistia algarum TaxID=2083279 RepID=UPI000CE72096|nr:efflux RND transporter periplasmic adaptor subunit [Kaistia algarum]MCX5515074.1 efflux RND transporter periplasmic adaptor subunit [Kaistia algarum]PPE79806.1 efflux RND transporter periplasmic adaptor subunit [Kaistia algarum]
MTSFLRFAASTALAIFLAGSGVAVLATPAAFGAEPAAAPPALPPSITVAPAARGVVVESETVVGSLVPREEVLVGVDLDGYRLTELDAEEGDTVKAGQVLARLSTDTLEVLLAQNASSLARNDAAIAQAKSQIAEAVATEVEAKASLERGASLQEKGFASASVLDQRRSLAGAASARRAAAEQGLAVAQADKTLTEALRRELELRLSKTEIKAPTDGIVLSRNARIGAIVSGAGEPLFRIAEDGAIELEAQVPETALSRIAIGQLVTIHSAGSDAVIEGKVRLVAPRIDAATRLGRVRIALPAGVKVNAGAFARGTIEVARHEGVTLPQSAIVTVAGKPTAQVVVDSKVQTRPLEIGISGGGVVEILSGVAEGDSVILRAGTFVRDGDEVTPVAAVQGAKG